MMARGDGAPPRVFERLLRAAGRRTRVGPAAEADLRREHAAWMRDGARWRADLRYAVVATGLAVRLFVEGWPGENGAVPGRGGGAAPLTADVRHAARGLMRAGGFTTTAGLTFAVGIGATAAVLAVVHGILLTPLRYPSADDLHVIEVNTGGAGWYGSSMPEFFDYEAQLPAFERIAAYSAGDVTMGDTLSPVRVRAVFASAALLPVLGVEPMLGRFFTPEEETSDNNRFVLLSHALWRDAYGADPQLPGRTIPLFGVDYVVLGVMPADFQFPDAETRAWFPFGMNRASPNPRMNHFLSVVGRLRDGQTIERASAELAAYTARAREQFPGIYSERGFRGRVRSLHERVVGDVRTPLVVVLATVALVLVIACVNVANLFLTRAESRARELAVRAALGASRGGLVRLLVTEGLLVAAGGALAGVALALAAVRVLPALAPTSLPRVDEIALGAVPVSAAAVVAILAGIAFGALPAVRMSRRVADAGLARGGRGVGTSRSGRRVRRGLVVAQLALATVVAVAAGLMLRTLHNLRAVPTGFDASGALTLSLSPSFSRYAQPGQRAAFWDLATERLGAVPGVLAVGATTALPLTDLYDNLSIRVEGRITTSIGDAPDARIQRVTPGFFEALGIPLVSGRLFTAADRADGEPVVVVSRAFATRFWPGQDALGRTMRVFSDRYPWLRVIGVVEDIPHGELGAAPEPMWYVPVAQAEHSYGTPLQLFVVLRLDRPVDAVLPAVRAAIAEVDPTAPVSRVQPLARLVDASIAARTFTFDVLRAFVLVALFLACIGVYGVAALTVAERRNEIGLRKALGADRSSILRLVGRESGATLAPGALAGLALALPATQLMESLLFGVGRIDPPTFASAVLVLALVATVATMLPALRALRIEPLDALRGDD